MVVVTFPWTGPEVKWNGTKSYQYPQSEVPILEALAGHNKEHDAQGKTWQKELVFSQQR